MAALGEHLSCLCYIKPADWPKSRQHKQEVTLTQYAALQLASLIIFAIATKQIVQNHLGRCRHRTEECNGTSVFF